MEQGCLARERGTAMLKRSTPEWPGDGPACDGLANVRRAGQPSGMGGGQLAEFGWGISPGRSQAARRSYRWWRPDRRRKSVRVKLPARLAASAPGGLVEKP